MSISTTFNKSTISIEPKYLFIVLLGIVLSFVSLQYIGLQKTVESKNVLTYGSVVGIAEEIARNGSVSEELKNLPLEPVLIAKLTQEIEHILSKTYTCPSCEVYLLQAKIPGTYPILGYGNIIIGAVQMKFGETWKVGMTCFCEDERYPNSNYYSNDALNINMNNNNLNYVPILKGDQKYILISEKILIYTYPLWSGNPQLIKPPGCKIFR